MPTRNKTVLQVYVTNLLKNRNVATMVLRLSPTPTRCEVYLFTGGRLFNGRRGCPARDTHQRAECVEGVPTPRPSKSRSVSPGARMSAAMQGSCRNAVSQGNVIPAVTFQRLAIRCCAGRRMKPPTSCSPRSSDHARSSNGAERSPKPRAPGAPGHRIASLTLAE